jgi:hypothetical protein
MPKHCFVVHPYNSIPLCSKKDMHENAAHLRGYICVIPCVIPKKANLRNRKDPWLPGAADKGND